MYGISSPVPSHVHIRNGDTTTGRDIVAWVWRPGIAAIYLQFGSPAAAEPGDRGVSFVYGIVADCKDCG